MKDVGERNQVMVGIVGIGLSIAFVVLVLNFRSPFGAPDPEYHAMFANAAQLKPGDRVRVMGVSSGTVESVNIRGRAVDVAFKIDGDLQLGGQTQASIEVGTVLGTMFLQVESVGPGHLKSGATIPLSRTTVPYTLNDVLQSAGGFIKGTDTGQLSSSLSELSTALGGISNSDAHAVLKGISSVAGAMGDQQDQLASLVQSASSVIGTLNKHSGDVAAVLGQANSFLADMRQRRFAINKLLTSTRTLSQQVSSLIKENGNELGALLTNLNSVTNVLVKNQAKLTNTIGELGQLSINLANATGSGPWIDVYSPTGPISDAQINGCGPKPDSSKGPCGVDK